MTRVSGWVWCAAAGILGLAAAGLVLNALAGTHGSPWWENAIGVVVVLISFALGLLITLRRPGNTIALLLLANAAIVVLAAIAFVFPDGHLPSARWRPVAIAVAATVVGAIVVGSLETGPFDPPYQRVENPLPTVPGIGWLWPLVLLGGIATLVAAVISVRVRFRHAGGLERLQLKWLAYSSFFIPATLLICLAFAPLGTGIDASVPFTLLVFLMLGAVPAAVGIAVLRYRLYDIDRLINRTLVYGVLTLLLAGTYVSVALLLGTALGSGSAWATAGATLLVAYVFRPLRARVQNAVDRRFSRSRYDGLRRIAAFLDDLRGGRAAPEAIEPMLREILSDPGLELRFWLPESEIYVDAHGRAPTDAPADARIRTPVTRAGIPLALVLHAPVNERPGFLEEIVEAAGLAIEIARLRVELRRQLEEVEASRSRILSAGYAERRRIERDLHDGAQQRLVSIGLALRHAQHGLGAGSNGTALVLDTAVTEIGQAIEELRELASGVRPAQLDGGLAPALRELAARSPLRVAIEISGGRFPNDLEAAAYFIASEGLTNAAKHAQAATVTLRAERTGGNLVVTVIDDGIGGATHARGSGLRGLSDRVEAHGGTFRLESADGHGTTIVAELPCES